MKTLRYYIFIIFALLSIDISAQNSAFANRNYSLDIDLGEIFEPMKLHEYYDTSNGDNNFGNSNNEICFLFTVYRPTLIVANFNGSTLSGVNARLLYLPLKGEGEEDYIDVTNLITEENCEEELPQRLEELSPYMNIYIDEKITHGWLGDLIFQMLQPGRYILYVEGDDAYGSQYNGVIRNNIYINPIGISSEQPVEVGYFSEDFNYQFSGSFVEYESDEVFYFINLNYPMRLNVSSLESVNVSSITLMTKAGEIIATSDDFPLENDSFPQIGEMDVIPGDYIVSIYFKECSDIHLDIAGRLDLLVGDRKESPLYIPVVSDGIDYTKTFDTSKYSNFYYSGSISHGKNTKDVFHCFVLEKPMDILISVPFCAMKGGTSVLLLNGDDKVLKVLNTSLQEYLLVENLALGEYYIVSEGNTEDGEMTLCVKGDKHYDYLISNNKNYITTFTPNIAISTSGLMNNPLKVRQSVNYYDRLGRLEQCVQYAASPVLEDYITYAEYDELGRESTKWLPIVSGNSAAYMPLVDVKRASLDLYQDAYAYERTIYEKSSLDRVSVSYGAGGEWQKTERGVKSLYRTNISNDHCKYFKVTGKRTLPILQIYSQEYPVYELEVTETRDEDEHLSYQYTDKRKNVILKRQIAENDTLDTYYVYDDFNNLCFVLPPIAADSLTENNMQKILDCYAYQYRYDSRNRSIGKKLPGCDWTENVYDSADRLLFSQNGEQRKRQEWSFQFSDLLGRQLLMGIYHGNIDPAAFESTNVYVAFAPGNVAAKYGYLVCAPEEVTLDSLEILQAKYFDTYEYRNYLSGFISSLNYVADENYGKCYDSDLVKGHCKGLLTGCMTRVLEDSQELYLSNYYDYNHNLIQSRQTTLTGEVTVTKSKFDFSGQPTASCEEHDNGVRLEKSYVYDHLGRLRERKHI